MNRLAALHRPAAALFAAFVVTGLAACEEPRPARMELRPAGPLKFTDTATVQKVYLAFYDDRGKPYPRKPTATFDAEDPSVVTVKALPDGATAALTAKKSGTTEVVVRAFGLEEKLKVQSQIVGEVRLTGKLPSKMKVGGKTAKAGFEVKDDRGQPIEGLRATFKASDYCITVDPDGTITPVSVGVCDVIVEVQGKTDSHTIEVR